MGMGQRLRVVAVAALLSGLCPCVMSGLTTSEIAQRAIPATVVVTSSTGGSYGSGCVVGENGVVLTCYHVLEGARSALIKVSTGAHFPVEGMLGFNAGQDLAVLKIGGRGLSSLPVGNSDKVSPGDRVVAVGNPRGLENTVSEGVVSAIRRVGDFPEALHKELLQRGRTDDDTLIQFTAPISPGNSGCPLIDSDGQVIGVVILGLPTADNVYFAVPVNRAKELLTSTSLIKLEEVDLTSIGGERRRIGMGREDLGLGQPVTKTVRAKLPKDSEPVFRASPGLQVDKASVAVVRQKDGARLEAVPNACQKGQYRVISDGSILFAKEDGGSEVSIAFSARPVRVAILPVLNLSGYEYLTRAVQNALMGNLRKWEFVLVTGAEVAAVVREERLNMDELMQDPEAGSPEVIGRIADRLNAKYVVFSGVAGSGYRGYFYSDVGVGLGIVMFDGQTGKPVLTKKQTATKDTTWSFKGSRATREDMIKGMVGRMLKEHFMIP